MKFATELAGVSWSNQQYKAKKGVITIPDENLGPFLPLIECGVLTPIEDAQAPAADPGNAQAPAADPGNAQTDPPTA